ncbi:hypothetical protein, partial [Haladaptatus sp.]|uniref:hypothetical protein n=1 Tax=Haladaptatus sp. TaxID=1973141 RepID=UPI003C666AC1
WGGCGAEAVAVLCLGVPVSEANGSSSERVSDGGLKGAGRSHEPASGTLSELASDCIRACLVVCAGNYPRAVQNADIPRNDRERAGAFWVFIVVLAVTRNSARNQLRSNPCR